MVQPQLEACRISSYLDSRSWGIAKNTLICYALPHVYISQPKNNVREIYTSWHEKRSSFKHFQDPDFIPKMETVLKRPSFYQLYQSENRVSPPLTHSTAGYESRSSAL